MCGAFVVTEGGLVLVSVIDGLVCVVLYQDDVVAALFVVTAVGVVFVASECVNVVMGVGLTVRRKVDFRVGGFDDKRSTTVFSHKTRNRIEHGSYWNCRTPPALSRVIHELDL